MRYIRILFISGLMVCATSYSHAQDWREHKSRHFIIYYNRAPIDFIKTVEEHAERYYQEISRDLGFTRYRKWSADKRAQIYIYDTPEDFLASGRIAHWSAATAQTRTKVIRSYPTAHGFFDSTLPHELGHIIFREFIGHNTRVPLWFEEGVAMYQEKAKRWGVNEDVRFALQEGSFMSIKELSSFYPHRQRSRKKIDLFYAEAASIVYYLIQEHGMSRFVRLCRKLQDGIAFEAALKKVYVRFKNLDSLNKAWVSYIKR